jgi:hypothetical protein
MVFSSRDGGCEIDRFTHFNSSRVTAVTGLKNCRKRAYHIEKNAVPTSTYVRGREFLVGGAGFEPATPSV